MRIIPISRGLMTVVDDEDFEMLSQWSWSARPANHGLPTFYAKRTDHSGERDRIVYMHRVIMGAGPGEIIDHIDGDGLNNRRTNLRHATVGENRRNFVKHRKLTSRFKGVCWQRHSWKAYITIDRRQYCLGLFKTEDAAARAYDGAAACFVPEFSRFNFPQTGQLSAIGDPAPGRAA
jgi:hypothetical protein